MSVPIKVLWFSPLPSFASQKNAYGGGGWISSLEREMAEREDLELAVAFFSPSCSEEMRRDGRVSHYCMDRSQSLFAKITRFFFISRQDSIDLTLCKRVIDSFKPDVIHIFGTETCFGLLTRETEIPIVIHLQGLIGPYLNAWIPPGYRMRDYVCQGWRNPFQIALGVRALAFNRHAAAREQEILRCCKAFMGRTVWDHAFVSLFAPQARYFTCWEALRPCFYEPGNWMPPKKPVFVSTISTPLYKGHDMVLKTARSLKESGLSDFEWRIYGVSDIRFAENKTGIRAGDVAVRPMGIATAEQLREALLHATCYVHPSYIDNSPNSICEAQMLGIPVIATRVGGVESLFPDPTFPGLVPANDPMFAASLLRKAVSNPSPFQTNRSFVELRHNPKRIADTVFSVYHSLLSGNLSPSIS